MTKSDTGCCEFCAEYDENDTSFDIIACGNDLCHCHSPSKADDWEEQFDLLYPHKFDNTKITVYQVKRIIPKLLSTYKATLREEVVKIPKNIKHTAPGKCLVCSTVSDILEVIDKS